MKLTLTALFAVVLSTSFVAAEDKQATAKQAVAKPAKDVTVKAPFKNHWDANSWEAGSGDNFWKATDKTKGAAKKSK